METETEPQSGGRWTTVSGTSLVCVCVSVCVTWVIKALVWDVVFDKGVAPQQKNADKSARL